MIEHLAAPQLGVFPPVVGDLLGDALLALALGREAEGLHLNEVQQAAEGVVYVRRPAAPGDRDRDRLAVEALADFVQGAVEIGPFAVHLVDEGDPRHVVLVGLVPDRLALGLDALARAEDHHRAVQDAQTSLHLGGEVDVAGRVDQVDGDVFPGKGHAGRLDRDAPLLLLFEEVGDGSALVHLAHAVAEAAVEQHALGERGLPGVDVSDDADVAERVDIAGHGD